MMPNIEELRLGLKLTEAAAERGEWDQSDWFVKYDCGTACCFAGNLLLHHGYQPEFLPDSAVAWTVTTPDGLVEVSAGNEARRLLGLNAVQAERLFHAQNSLADLRSIVAELCEEGDA
jgi:hypothetical protein